MLTVLHHQNDCMDDIDHLFLLPERALQMDSTTLQKDLAGLDFDPRLMHAAPMGNIWLSGVIDANLKQTRPCLPKTGGTLHWFACMGSEDTAARSETSEEREQRLRMLRDKQNEERQRKLEELKAQALAAQRFREMKEEERRRRIEELRVRDSDRRQQVGERKRLIYEAERDRRESILKKNMEREHRFELKRRNERSSLAFAFGSSTPRMLEPADTGGSFWGHRRATSTNNIMFAAVPLTRRSSERELDGSKKRATSAGGLDRNAVDDLRMSTSMYEAVHWGDLPSPNSSSSVVVRSSIYPQSKIHPNLDESTTYTVRPSLSISSLLGSGDTVPAGCVSGHVGRRRTDLMPTIPTRDSASATASSRKHFTKSPGPSRPDSSLSQQSTSSVSSNVNMRSRPVAAPRKPRPASIAVTGVTHDSNKNPLLISDTKKPFSAGDVTKPPLPRSRKTSVGKVAEKNITSKLSKTSPKTTPKVTPLQSPCTDAPMLPPPVPSAPPASVTATVTAAPIVEAQTGEADIVEVNESVEVTVSLETVEAVPEKEPEQMLVDLIPVSVAPLAEPVQESLLEPLINIEETTSNNKIEPQQKQTPVKQVQQATLVQQPSPAQATPPQQTPAHQHSSSKHQQELHQQHHLEEPILDMADMTASMIAKVRITTEEEAKAALAERRRLAREEAERQAEAERLRAEEEYRLEMERQRQEEEQLRQMAEDQRHAEEERLAQAIKETQKRDEEEKLRREEEAKQKVEKEEQERKAREESEKQRIEMQERLKQEEKEREARRKRVEAIMLRTRASKGGSPGNLPKDESSEKGSIDEDSKNNQVINNKPTIESYEKEVNEKEAALFNGSFIKTQKENGENHEEPQEQHSNGHRNGVDTNTTEDYSKINKSLIEHNVTNTLLDLGELDPFKNANTSLEIPADKITNEDSVNSNNNPAESHSTTDFLL